MTLTLTCEFAEYFTCQFTGSTCPELLYNVPVNEADNEFTWSFTSGATPSGRSGIQTGPFGDHTTGGGEEGRGRALWKGGQGWRENKARGRLEGQSTGAQDRDRV